MSVCVIPWRHARLRWPIGLHHVIITLPKPKKSFNWHAELNQPLVAALPTIKG